MAHPSQPLSPFERASRTGLCPLPFLAAWLLVGWPLAAHAEPADVAVLGITRGEEHLEELAALAQSVSEDLRQRGVSSVPAAEAAETLERTHSRAPQAVNPTDLAALTHEADGAAGALADGRLRETLTRVERVQSLADMGMDAFGRDAKARGAIFKACVAGIQAELQSDDLSSAQKLSTWCVSAFPDLDPARAKLPSPVRASLLEAVAALDGSSTAFSIESAPSGCAVFLQGQRVGTTPYPLVHPARRSYAVQVECDQQLQSRTHVIKPAERHQLLIDMRFDAALQTSQELVHLRYPRPHETEWRAHAQRVGALLSTREVIVLETPSAGRVSIHRLTDKTGTFADLLLPYKPSDVHAALGLLFNAEEQTARPVGRTEPRASREGTDEQSEGGAPEEGKDESEPELETDSAAVPPKDDHGSERSRAWRVWVGAPLATAGVAVTVAGGLLLRKRLRAGERYQTATPLSLDILTRQRAWQRLGAPLHRVSIAGSALATVGAGLLAGQLEPDRAIWLPITASVLGVTGIVFGSVELARGHRCDPVHTHDLQSCVVQQGHRDRGGVLMLASAPLAVFSGVWFARWLAPGFDANLATNASKTGWNLTLSGRF